MSGYRRTNIAEAIHEPAESEIDGVRSLHSKKLVDAGFDFAPSCARQSAQAIPVPEPDYRTRRAVACQRRQDAGVARVIERMRRFVFTRRIHLRKRLAWVGGAIQRVTDRADDACRELASRFCVDRLQRWRCGEL